MDHDNERRARRASTGDAQAQLKVRISQDLRDHLEAAASAKGVSLNREINDRLERSRTEEVSSSQLGGDLAPIVELLARSMLKVGEALGHLDPTAREKGPWRSAYVFDQAVRAASAVLAVFRPRDQMPDFTATPWMEDVGETVANDLVSAILMTPGPGWEERLHAQIGDGLERGAIDIPHFPAEWKRPTKEEDASDG